MATTCNRFALVDDTGTFAAPDGTGSVLDDAFLQAIFDVIDEIVRETVSFGGLLNAEGFGIHQLAASGNGGNELHVSNALAGSNNYSAFVALGDASYGALTALSSAYATTTVYRASGVALESSGSGGLSIASLHAASTATLRFYAGSVEHLLLHPSGGLSLGVAADPGGGVFLTSAAVRFGGLLAVNRPATVFDGALLVYNAETQRLQLTNNALPYGNVSIDSDIHFCAVYHSGAQSIIGDNTFRPLTFDSKDSDTNNLHTAGAPTRFTINKAGLYVFTGHSGTSPVSAAAKIGIRIDGGAVFAVIGAGDNQLGLMTSFMVNLAVGQYVELVVSASSTANWGNVSRPLASQFMAHRLAYSAA